MAIPSRLFYDSQLIFHVKPDKSLLPDLNVSKGILFNGINGDDERDGDSTSWYNYNEVLAMETSLRLLYANNVAITDIGIITLYRKQVDIIKRHILKKNIPECKVATIEELQGDERIVIIVSLVRLSE